jgi:hypothetical protein
MKKNLRQCRAASSENAASNSTNALASKPSSRALIVKSKDFTKRKEGMRS